MQKKETFDEWVEKHADAIVDEVLKEAEKNTGGEYRLYNDIGGLINTFTDRKTAIRVAKKKHLTIKHVKQTVTQPQ